jgi:hypothetical protein
MPRPSIPVAVVPNDSHRGSRALADLDVQVIHAPTVRLDINRDRDAVARRAKPLRETDL